MGLPDFVGFRCVTIDAHLLMYAAKLVYFIFAIVSFANKFPTAFHSQPTSLKVRVRHYGKSPRPFHELFG